MRIQGGTVVVITGGARGLGRALVRACVERQATVAAWDRDAGALRQLTTNIASDRLFTHGVDVADETAVAAATAATLQRCLTVDVLVNNAGIAAAAPTEHMALEDYRRVFDVNFLGAVHCTRSLLPALQSRESAAIVNVLSLFALIGFPTKGAYSASKFALRSFTETLQTEYAGTPITVTAAYAGAVATGIVDTSATWSVESRRREAEFLRARGQPPERVAAAIVRAIESKRRRVCIGADVKAVDFASRVAPSMVVRLIGRYRRRVPFLADF